jgi:hypothetical protein
MHLSIFREFWIVSLSASKFADGMLAGNAFSSQQVQFTLPTSSHNALSDFGKLYHYAISTQIAINSHPLIYWLAVFNHRID